MSRVPEILIIPPTKSVQAERVRRGPGFSAVSLLDPVPLDKLLALSRALDERGDEIRKVN